MNERGMNEGELRPETLTAFAADLGRAPVATPARAGSDVPSLDSMRPKKLVKEYDFRRPEKFSRDQLRTMRGIHEQFTRLLNSTLAGYLRTSVQFTLDAVEQASYEEFTSQAGDGSLIYVITLDPLPAPLLLEVSAELVFTSLDRLLGGTGRRLHLERDTTEMERALFKENWLMPVLDNLRAAWQNIVELSPSISAVDTNAGFVQIALPSDVVVAVTTSAAIGDGEGVVRFCYTYATLEPIVPQLDTQRLIATGPGRRQPEEVEHLRRGLAAVRVPIIVRLGEAEVTMSELLELQAGDVIRLSTLVEQEVEVLVNGELKYQARPGMVKHHLAVRLTTILDSEDDHLGNAYVAGK
jgi:flagellar motor switch protein FliM